MCGAAARVCFYETISAVTAVCCGVHIRSLLLYRGGVCVLCVVVFIPLNTNIFIPFAFLSTKSVKKTFLFFIFMHGEKKGAPHDGRTVDAAPQKGGAVAPGYITNQAHFMACSIGKIKLLVFLCVRARVCEPKGAATARSWRRSILKRQRRSRTSTTRSSSPRWVGGWAEIFFVSAPGLAIGTSYFMNVYDRYIIILYEVCASCCHAQLEI